MNDSTKRQQKLRATKKAIRIWNSPKRDLVIQREAKKLGISKAEFVNLCVEEHLKKCILSYDKNMLERLEFQIRKVGNNINQQVHLCHIRGHVSPNDYVRLQDQIKALESFIRNTFSNPPELGKMLREALKQHPTFKEIVLQILNESP